MGLILALLALIAALYVGALYAATPSPASVATPVVTRCHTVTAETYNRRVDTLDQITGRKHHRARRKVCKHTTYKRLGARVREARRNCLHRVEHPTRPTTAGTLGWSFYGYGDSGGLTGACGAYLPNPIFDYTYAILRSGALPSDCGGPGYWFHRAGVTRHGTQADTGDGGGRSPSGELRTFDFWDASSNPVGTHRPGLAVDLRVKRDGTGSVQYSRNNCWAR